MCEPCPQPPSSPAARHRVFIVSVGTSIAEKYDKTATSTQKLNLNNGAETVNPAKQTAFTEWAKNGQEIGKKSAELSSLLQEPDAATPSDAVVLLHTATLAGRVCACGLNAALGPQVGAVTVREIEGLGGPEDPAFVTRGLPGLLSCLKEEITKGRADGAEVVLVPTGGYKAIIPYFVIAAMLFDCPCRYVYEQADTVITLPSLPLHVDFKQWSHVEALLEVFRGRSAADADRVAPWKAHWKHRTEMLLVDQGGKLDETAVAGVFREKADGERGKSRLQYHTENSPLLHYLGDFGGRFMRLAAVGPYLWKGDRVPEMADHALLHHADLFATAERLLLPVFCAAETNGSGPFLRPAELFALLCAVHLHDCGHVLAGVEVNGGGFHRFFPTEVREHHHVLGFLRLTEPDRHGGVGQPVYAALKDKSGGIAGTAWGDTDPEVLTGLFPAALLGLYHRKKMRLFEGDHWPFVEGHRGRFFKGDVPPLRSLVEDKGACGLLSEAGLDTARLPLLVALLRIIDSLDEQHSRVGGPVNYQFHAAMLESQRHFEARRQEGLKALLSTAVPPATFTELDGILGESITDDKKLSESAVAFRQWQAANPSLAPEGVFEYAFSRIYAKFMDFQKTPLGAKLPVRAVRLSHAARGPNVAFRVSVEVEEGGNPSGLLKSLREEYDGCPECLEGEPVVKRLLGKSGITLAYG